MTKIEALQQFHERKVRSIYDDEAEKWYFSIVDVIEVLTDSPTPRKYWSVLKGRLKKEMGELTTICSQLKLVASDGKKYLTDVADQEQLFRIIQSVPSPKAEPFKRWMAQVASERIDQLQDPELSIQQAMQDYARLGYSENWINNRIKSMEVRKGLTDEWKRTGIQGQQYATLTDIITKEWSGFTTRDYKKHKGLRKENLRDNMTTTELILNMLAEQATTEISKSRDPQGLEQGKAVAKAGGFVAKTARRQLERQLGHAVVTRDKAADHLKPLESNTDTSGTLPENT